MFKQTVIAGLTAAALGSGLAQAQQPSASPHTYTGNVGFFSQYIFRGLTQTNKEPALQGGFDYSHASGFYVGTWASNVSWLRDNSSYRAGGSLEWDIYGGYKGSIARTDLGYDVGLLYYWYPGDVAPGAVKADTTEIYGALSWKWLTGKLSYSIDNKTFGATDSRGTYYLDLTANYPIPSSKLTAVIHFGIQKYDGQTPGLAVSNDSAYSYNDWKLGINFSLPKDYTVGLFYTDTSGANSAFYGPPTYPRDISKGTATAFVQKTF
jgi:uncharacterized protein (TIGR02001 family)